MPDGWFLARVIIGASALVFVLYMVFGVTLPWWRRQQVPGREQELERRLERLRDRQRHRNGPALQDESEAEEEGTDRCD